jgi:hypothetical protein
LGIFVLYLRDRASFAAELAKSMGLAAARLGSLPAALDEVKTFCDANATAALRTLIGGSIDDDPGLKEFGCTVRHF